MERFLDRAVKLDVGWEFRRWDPRLRELIQSRSNHLPDGPEQRARDAALAGEDPLVASGWIYSHGPEAAAAEIAD
jgi:hypothetical protein